MATLTIQDKKAIDVHSHFGEWDITIAPLEEFPFFATDLEYLLQNMENANIGISINSHMYSFIPREHGNSFLCNKMCLPIINKYSNLYMWAVVNPKTTRNLRSGGRAVKAR